MNLRISGFGFSIPVDTRKCSPAVPRKEGLCKTQDDANEVSLLPFPENRSPCGVVVAMFMWYAPKSAYGSEDLKAVTRRAVEKVLIATTGK